MKDVNYTTSNKEKKRERKIEKRDDNEEKEQQQEDGAKRQRNLLMKTRFSIPGKVKKEERNGERNRFAREREKALFVVHFFSLQVSRETCEVYIHPRSTK